MSRIPASMPVVLREGVTATIGAVAWATGSVLALQPARVPVEWGILIGVCSFIGGLALSSLRAGREWGRLEGKFATADQRTESIEQKVDEQATLLQDIRRELADLAKLVAEIRGERRAEAVERRPRQRRQS